MDETKRLEADVTLPRTRMAEILALLRIDNLEDMSEEELDAEGAKQHDRQFVYEAGFPDGSTVAYELCSGSMNYWGDVVWTSPDRTETVDCEPEYGLDDLELEIDDKTYVVKLRAVAG